MKELETRERKRQEKVRKDQEIREEERSKKLHDVEEQRF